MLEGRVRWTQSIRRQDAAPEAQKGKIEIPLSKDLDYIYSEDLSLLLNGLDPNRDSFEKNAPHRRVVEIIPWPDCPHANREHNIEMLLQPLLTI